MTRHDESGPMKRVHKPVSLLPNVKTGYDPKQDKTPIPLGRGIHTYTFLDAQGVVQKQTATDLGMLIILSKAGYAVELKKPLARP
jgi:hypothetical protein